MIAAWCWPARRSASPSTSPSSTAWTKTSSGYASRARSLRPVSCSVTSRSNSASTARRTTSRVRLFVAAYPSRTALEHLATEVTSLPMVAYARDRDTNVRLANPALWHVTLAFLGDVEDERLDSAIGALDAAAASVPAPASIRIAGGGT